jgi:hypothetical protein
MDNKYLEEACKNLAAFTVNEEGDSFAALKDGLIDQICRENHYPDDQATLIVENTIDRLRGKWPERVATLELRDGEHRLPSGGVLIVKDSLIHELHAPLRVRQMDTDHAARQITVEEANKAARCDFYVMSLWERTHKSWVARWFNGGKERC